MRRLVCNIEHAWCIRTNGFSNGKAYTVTHREGSGYVVKNDNGHDRFILPGEPSAHLMGGLVPAGKFEWEEE